ncbi:MAG: hypothetical protein U0796_22190 [Gemmatales bacterium]
MSAATTNVDTTSDPYAWMMKAGSNDTIPLPSTTPDAIADLKETMSEDPELARIAEGILAVHEQVSNTEKLLATTSYHVSLLLKHVFPGLKLESDCTPAQRVGKCSVCSGEYCTRGDEVICLQCNRPRDPNPDPSQTDVEKVEKRKSWMAEQARIKVKRQKVVAETAPVNR